MLTHKHYFLICETLLDSLTHLAWHKKPYGSQLVDHSLQFDLVSLFSQTTNFGRAPLFKKFDCFFFDVDSTLIEQETIDEVAKRFDLYQQMHHVTVEAMAGKIDFARSVADRVRLLSGIDATEFEKITERLSLNPYVFELISFLKQCGTKIVLISGGFTSTVEHFAKLVQADAFYANELEVKNGKLTGRILGQILDSERKAFYIEETCKTFKLDPQKCAFVGDGANDRHALDYAGWAIGYQPKPVLYPHLDLKLGREGYKFLLRYLEAV